MKVKQLKRKMAALLAVAMVMTGQPSGVLAGGMPGDSGEASTEVTETVSTDSDATQNTEPDGSEIPPASNSTADSGTSGGNGGTVTEIPKEEQETFEVTYQVEPEEGAKVTGDRTVKTGETLEFTVRVNEGYELDSVSVSGDVLEPTKEEDNKYSYEAENIMQAPEVEVSLVEAPILMTLMELNDATPSTADDTWYVSEGGDDTDGNGSEARPYASLTKAVKEVVHGATIELLSDVEANSLALVDAKKITINGNGYTVTRASGFTPKNDARGGYNPAMIEVANGSELILKNITLDDGFLREADEFLEQPTSGDHKDNESKVQDAIIAAYHGGGTITLGSGTTLKNFGGMSAVRVGGQGESDSSSSKLIMEDGSKIIDDNLGSRKGGAAAIWSQGGIVEIENGASINSIDGRAIFLEDGGVADVYGAISDITANSYMTFDPGKGDNLGSGGTGNGFAGIAAAITGNSTFTLGEGGTVSNIVSDAGNASDIAFMLVGSSLITENGSKISDINTIGIVDNNGGKININGTVSNCTTKNVLFRLRGAAVTFVLGESGLIENVSTTDAGIVYLNGGTPTVEISGTIQNAEVGRTSWAVIFMSSNGVREQGTLKLTSTGKITNITKGYAITAQESAKVSIDGEISNCSGYALEYKTYKTSLVDIGKNARISNTNGIYITKGQTANDTNQHVVFESGASISDVVRISAFNITLNDGYSTFKLGNASADAATAIKTSVTEQHSDWKVIGSNAAWIQPSESEVHLTVDRPSSVKKMGLFAAYVPLNEDGTPVEGEEAVLTEIDNSETLDIELTGLTAGQSYALMLVNNAEYTLTPDDITIYTGGGQGDEAYDDGFPAVTLTNSIDIEFVKNPETGKYGYDLKSLEVNGKEYTATAEKSLVEQLVALVEATYTYEDNSVATDDSKPGEYAVTLSWKDGLSDKDVRANGNDVKLGGGTLIVRHTDDIKGAQDGTTTHALLPSEPTAPVTEHAEAIAPANSKFYTNDDTNREVDASGIQLLDDGLLLEGDDNRQELMEQKAADHLGAPGEGQAYRYEFHYLDLVDAFNGNAWVSASKGTTVYLPYPEGVTEDTAGEFGVKVLHYKDLHREYGISGQAEVEEAIAACELEEVPVTYDSNGIKFDVAREGFSPFAVVWKMPARTITVEYWDYDTKEQLAPDTAAPVTRTYAEGETYDVTDVTVEKKIEGYTYVESDPAVTGKVEGKMTIKAFYSKIPSNTVTINYLDNATNEEIEEAYISKPIFVGEEYNVTQWANKAIEGYTFDRIEGNVTGTMTKDGVIIKVYYDAIPKEDDDDHGGSTGGSPSGSGSSGGSGAAYTVGLNGNWVHMDPNDINTPISQMVPDGATPVSNPEWHQWKFILTDGSALTNRWAFIRNPYAVEGQPSEGWFSFDENGIMNYGWYLDQSTGKWYFLHRQSDGMLGTMMEGWHHDEQDGRWYYLQPGSGEMLLGWQEIGGRWYYFNPNAPQVTWNYNEATGGWTYNGSQSRPYGSMYQNEVTPDGYQVDGSGAWVQ